MDDKSRIDRLKSRLLRLVEKRLDGKGCWVWTGAKVWKNPQLPYGYMTVEGHRVNVRRVSYEVHGLSPGLTDHTVVSTCGNSLCVRPDHLRRGSRRKSNGAPKGGG